MLSNKTRRRIKEHKWSEHSNTSLFFKRIKNQSVAAFADLTLLAQHLDQAQLEEIFTSENLEPLIKSLMHPKSTRPGYKLSKEEKNRIFAIGYIFSLQALAVMQSYIKNKWAATYYAEHVMPMQNILLGLKQEQEEDN